MNHFMKVLRPPPRHVINKSMNVRGYYHTTVYTEQNKQGSDEIDS